MNALQAGPDSSMFRQKLLAMCGIALVAMLVALDQTVVSTSLPSMVSELNGFEYYAWIVNGYLLASVGVVPVFGRLGDFFGRKPFIASAIAIFTVASLLCGLANSMPMLIAARALQGFGGGMMVGTAYAAVPDLFPDAKSRVRWQVVIVVAAGLGNALGPTLGGLLTENFGWRSTFLINLPVGLACFYCVYRFLPSSKGQHGAGEKVKIDILGAVLITAVLAALQLAVERIPESGFTMSNIVLLGLVFISFGLFIQCERKALHPIIPLSLFKNSDLVKMNLLGVVIGFVLFSLLFFTPLLLQGGFGLSPREAGLIATPLAACIAIGSFINTRIVIHLAKPVAILTVGFSLMTGAAVGLGFAGASTPHWLFVVFLVMAGLGLGFSINNLNVFSQGIAGREYFGIVTALLQSTRMVGGMLGTTLVGTVVSRHYSSNIVNVVQQPVGGGLGPDMVAKFSDPQLLVDAAAQTHVSEALQTLSLNPQPLMAAARELLVTSIHYGMALTAACALLAVFITLRLMHVRFKSSEVSANAPSQSH
jgi:EmrB/QacA subfamily drug resistance transporter